MGRVKRILSESNIAGTMFLSFLTLETSPERLDSPCEMSPVDLMISVDPTSGVTRRLAVSRDESYYVSHAEEALGKTHQRHTAWADTPESHTRVTHC